MKNKNYTTNSIVKDCFKATEEDELMTMKHLTRIKKIQRELRERKKEIDQGNLTFRVMLRALNCEYKGEKVMFSLKEMRNWFEHAEHLKTYKEIDTI